MSPADLLDRFRLDVNDLKKPPLWSNDEIADYTNWAIEQFCIGWGGIVDSSSPATLLRAVANQPFSKISSRILKVNYVWALDTYQRIDTLNLADLMKPRVIDDYGFTLKQVYDTRPGPVRAVVLGMEPNAVRFVDVPQEDAQFRMNIFRLPLKRVCCDDDCALEIPNEFFETLLFGMKGLAYQKQDAETFNKSKAQEFISTFNSYVRQAKSTREAREAKVRVVQYGGI